LFGACEFSSCQALLDEGFELGFEIEGHDFTIPHARRKEMSRPASLCHARKGPGCPLASVTRLRIARSSVAEQGLASAGLLSKNSMMPPPCGQEVLLETGAQVKY